MLGLVTYIDRNIMEYILPIICFFIQQFRFVSIATYVISWHWTEHGRHVSAPEPSEVGGPGKPSTSFWRHKRYLWAIFAYLAGRLGKATLAFQTRHPRPKAQQHRGPKASPANELLQWTSPCWCPWGLSQPGCAAHKPYRTSAVNNSDYFWVSGDDRSTLQVSHRINMLYPWPLVTSDDAAKRHSRVQ